MAVAQLYHHIAPRNEVGIIAKPLIRLLKGHREVQSVVLSNIATMSSQRSVSHQPTSLCVCLVVMLGFEELISLLWKMFSRWPACSSLVL